MLQQTIPIFRIFDLEKAREFYLYWLGFTVEFEHQFEPGTPYYIGIRKDDIRIHLSEHHGDSTPGSKLFIVCTGIRGYFEEITGRPYRYYRPTLAETFYGTLEFTVQDPFGNRLSFNEYMDEPPR